MTVGKKMLKMQIFGFKGLTFLSTWGKEQVMKEKAWKEITMETQKKGRRRRRRETECGEVGLVRKKRSVYYMLKNGKGFSFACKTLGK